MFRNTKTKYFWLLAAAATVLLITFLGVALFNTKGEPREAVVALSMLQSGDWISPINNGVDIAYKPPFFHWCIAICSLPLGRVSEFTARFPSALATIVMLLVAYRAMLRNKTDERLAFLSGLITLTAFEIHRASMACRVDMVLSALIVMAIYLFQSWYENRRKAYIPFIILTMSGAFLTKGPVGVILPCATVGCFMLIRGEKILRAFCTCLLFALASCVLPLAWYWMAYLERGNAFLYLVFEENFLRFTGKMVYSSHEEPIYYNFLTMLAGFLPYTIMLLIVLFTVKFASLHTAASPKNWGRKLWFKIKAMDSQSLISLISAVLIFCFYCVPKSKRSVYLLPVYPFVAYFVAKCMMFISRKNFRTFSIYGWIMATITALLPIIFIATKCGAVPNSIFRGKHAAENVAYLTSIETTPLTIVNIALLTFTLYSIYLFVKTVRQKRQYAACLSVIGMVFMAYLMLDGIVLPRIYEVKTDYYVAQEIGKLVPEGKIWDYRSDFKPGDRNRMHQFSINFYLNDRVKPLDLNRPANGFIIMGDEDIVPFAETYPSYKLKKIKRFDHRSCDDKRKLTLFSFTSN